MARATPTAPDPDRWEHQLLLREGMDELLAELDRLGNEFWELVQVMHIQGGWAAMMKRSFRARELAEKGAGKK